MTHFYKTQHFVWFHVVEDLVPFVSLKRFELDVFQFYSRMVGVFHSLRLSTGLRLWYKLMKDCCCRYYIQNFLIKIYPNIIIDADIINEHTLIFDMSGTGDAPLRLSSKNLFHASANTNVMDKISKFSWQNSGYNFWGNNYNKYSYFRNSQKHQIMQKL